MNALEQLMTIIQEAGIALKETPRKGQTRYIGASADQKTALEVVGQIGNIKGLQLACVMGPDDLDAAARNGRMIDAVLALVAPHWGGRVGWFRQACSRFAESRAQLLASRQSMTAHAEVATMKADLTFLPTTNTVTLKVRVK